MYFKHRTVSRKSRRTRRLRLEGLERRELLSIDLFGTQLQILGADNSDTAQVRLDNGRIYAELNATTMSWMPHLVTSIWFAGYGGNDTFTNYTSLPTLAYGDAGNDRITGGIGDDVLYGGSGDDFLDGVAGNDRLYGENGNDRLEGGDGVDQLYGQAGADVIFGEHGNDSIFGGTEGDTVYAGDGNDYIEGNAGNDYLSGENGDDTISAGDGDDTLYGHVGIDRLHGDAGNDTIYAGNDRDYVYGEGGNDTLHGEAGDDDVSGDDGNDRVYGDAGDDRIYGNNDNDHLYGGSGADRFYGGNGNDTLVSLDAAATDILYGQADFDSFWTDELDTISDAVASEIATNIHRIGRFANGADRTLDGDRIADPTDGRNYKNFADRPLFDAAGPTENDIDQGSLGDCWLMASMGAVARTSQNTVRQTVVDLGDGTYAVRLGGDDFFRVDADLPTLGAASWTPTYAGLGVSNSLWAAVVEKAYTHFRSGANTYASIAGGLGVEALPGLNATSADDKYFSSYASGRAILDDIASKLSAGRAVTCGFDVVGGGAGVIADHEYTVVGVNRDAAGTVISVILRNPHGPAGAAATVTVTGAELFACDGSIAWGTVA